MPKPCAVCAHLERAAIDLELVRQVVNVSALARKYGLHRMSVDRHRNEHLPAFLKVYGANAQLPTAGELHGELLRLYSAALDNLALAQAGVLIDVSDDGLEHRKVSVTSIARAISEARKTLDSIVSLAADGATENERPMGLAQGELSERVAAGLQQLLKRANAPTLESEHAPLPTLAITAEPEHPSEGTAGSMIGEPGAPTSSSLPLDAVKAVSTLPGIASRPVIAEIIEADLKNSAPTPAEVLQPAIMTVPNPRYPGSAASSPEERSAAGYPDIELTLDDLKASSGEIAALVAARRSPQAAGER